MSYVRTLRHICVDLIFTVSFQDRQHFEFNLFKFLRQKLLTFLQLKFIKKTEIKKFVTP